MTELDKDRYRLFLETQRSENWQKRHIPSTFNTTISAGMAASIFGFGYDEPWVLFRKMTGQIPIEQLEAEAEEKENNYAIIQGQIQEEDAVWNCIYNEYKGCMLHSPGTIISPTKPWLMASLDLILLWFSQDGFCQIPKMTELAVELKFGGTKIKCVDDIVTSGYLKHYVQVQFQLHCLDPKAELAWLFFYYHDEKKKRTCVTAFKIYRDNAIIKKMIRRLEWFRLLVQSYNEGNYNQNIEDAIIDKDNDWMLKLKQEIIDSLFSHTELIMKRDVVDGKLVLNDVKGKIESIGNLVEDTFTSLGSDHLDQGNEIAVKQ